MSEHWGPYVTIICIVLAVLYVAHEAENRGAELAKACMQAGGSPEMAGAQFKACHKQRTPEADR